MKIINTWLFVLHSTFKPTILLLFSKVLCIQGDWEIGSDYERIRLESVH
jgi:hypothetical protein